MSTIAINNVKKEFGPVKVLKGINLDIKKGEFIVLVGPSGCGKSTLLNLIAGLETISSGEIAIGSRVVNNVSPKDRDIAMVFQSYALYPTMNVRENLSFGLETRKVPKAERDQIIDNVAKILQIGPFMDRKPSQLSGGQRQRVAMGRALARNPQVFLFDEPLSNLDAKLRVEMRTEIKKLHQEIKTTMVYVTHDQIEAMTLADRIAIMKDGILQQFDTPQQVYDNPANLFVAGFMGSPPMNFIPCPLVKHEGGLGVEIDAGLEKKFIIPVKPTASLEAYVNKKLIMGVRPEQMAHGFAGEKDNPDIYPIDCRVAVVEPTGADTLVFTPLNGKEVTCRVHPEEAKGPGEVMRLMVDMSKAIFFDEGSGKRIS